MSQQLTVTLTDEQVQMISEKVRAGEFASAEDLVTAALETFAGHDESSLLQPDDVLRELIDEALADPTTFTPQQVHEELLRHHQERLAIQQLAKDKPSLAR